MCVVTSSAAAIAAAAAMAISAAATTAVTLTQVSANKKIAAYQLENQVEQTKREAKKAEMEAAYARQDGVEDARKQKINAILNMENEKAKMAGGNISMSSGTVLNLADDLKINSELDALTTQKNSERRAQNYIDNYMDRANSLNQKATLISFKNKVNTQNSYIQLGSKNASTAAEFFGKRDKL